MGVKQHSEESKQKIRASLMGHPVSDESRKKMSDAVKKHLEKPGVIETLRQNSTGRTHSVSPEARKKIGDALRGRPKTDEHKRKLSETNTQPEIRIKLSNSHMGEKNPQWKGGVSFEPYCIKFTKEFKERVRAFFGHQCQFPGCGHVWKEGEKKLAVHHVNFNKEACCDEDVIPLFVPVCSDGCHGKTNSNRDHWEQYFSEMINTRFKGKCYLTKQEMVIFGQDRGVV